MTTAIQTLVNNPAFWTFLGIAVTSYFGYKQVMKKTPVGKMKADVHNVSSFEELRAVVEVLQGELLKKDKRHKDDTDYILSQLREARSEVGRLTQDLADSVKNNSQCTQKIAHLENKLKQHGLSE